MQPRLDGLLHVINSGLHPVEHFFLPMMDKLPVVGIFADALAGKGRKKSFLRVIELRTEIISHENPMLD
jgi:hypothetical protein